MPETQEKKKKSYGWLTLIAGISFVIFFGTLLFEIMKPIIYNQYPFLSIILKISVGVTIISLICQLILAIIDGTQSIKEKRNNHKMAQAQQQQQPVENNNYQVQPQPNYDNMQQQPQPINNNDGFQNLISPVHSNVTLQTKFEGKTFIVRIKQKMRLINNQQ